LAGVTVLGDSVKLILAAAALAVATPAAWAQEPAAPPAAPAAAPAPAPACCVIPAGTPVVLELLDELSSRTAMRGDHFAMRLVEPITVDGRVLAPAGARGTGEVVDAAKAGMGGRPGELTVAARYLAVGDLQIPLRGLKLDPGITYLQTQYRDLEHVKWAIDLFGDEMPMHIEMTRFDGQIVFAGLPIVRYTTEARLEEIIRLHETNGCLVFNPHRYTLEEGGMKKTDRNQLEFKKQADPKGILNPGKMIAWDDPNFDFDSGRAWLFEGLKTLGAA